MVIRIEEEELEAAITHSLLRDDMGHSWFMPNTDKALLNIAMGADTLVRDKQRSDRAQLNSGHGDTAETHDQFYRDHKLLLILFQALAVMPITRSSPGKITFSWRSGATIYAICFYVATSCVVLVVGYERVKILQTTSKFDEYIYAIVFIMFLVPHFWIPFVGWGVANHVAVYKTMWGAFQASWIQGLMADERSAICKQLL